MHPRGIVEGNYLREGQINATTHNEKRHSPEKRDCGAGPEILSKELRKKKRVMMNQMARARIAVERANKIVANMSGKKTSDPSTMGLAFIHSRPGVRVDALHVIDIED